MQTSVSPGTRRCSCRATKVPQWLPDGNRFWYRNKTATGAEFVLVDPVRNTLDDNVHPANTIQLVDELIKANRTFDLIIAPNRAHGLNEPYFIRRRWDYLCNI